MKKTIRNILLFLLLLFLLNFVRVYRGQVLLKDALDSIDTGTGSYTLEFELYGLVPITSAETDDEVDAALQDYVDALQINQKKGFWHYFGKYDHLEGGTYYHLYITAGRRTVVIEGRGENNCIVTLRNSFGYPVAEVPFTAGYREQAQLFVSVGLTY